MSQFLTIISVFHVFAFLLRVSWRKGTNKVNEFLPKNPNFLIAISLLKHDDCTPTKVYWYKVTYKVLLWLKFCQNQTMFWWSLYTCSTPPGDDSWQALIEVDSIFFIQRLVIVKFPPPCHCQVPSALSLSSSLRLVTVKFPPPCHCQVPSTLSLPSSLRLVTVKFPPPCRCQVPSALSLASSLQIFFHLTLTVFIFFEFPFRFVEGLFLYIRDHMAMNR